MERRSPRSAASIRFCAISALFAKIRRRRDLRDRWRARDGGCNCLRLYRSRSYSIIVFMYMFGLRYRAVCFGGALWMLGLCLVGLVWSFVAILSLVGFRSREIVWKFCKKILYWDGVFVFTLVRYKGRWFSAYGTEIINCILFLGFYKYSFKYVFH